MTLVDSPGMIGAAVDSGGRDYDFTAVVRHFAQRADLVLFFFDPDKPGTTGETMSVFTQALDGISHKLLILMNKVDKFANIRDFARAYGALCWNLSKVIQSALMIGSRAGVIVTTTSAPGTISSRSVEARISKLSYFGCCAATKLSSVACDRLQTRTSSQSKISLQVANAPSAIWPAPTIARRFESLRASHLADTAPAAPVRITVW